MNPKVSVVTPVYNYSYCLRQCLDSIIAQKVNFPVEVVIHDDASPDGSADIIREYDAKHPGLFVPILQKENQYSQGRTAIISQFCIEHVHGEYMAIIEGDDYWCDNDNLQRQADYLDAHPEVGLVYGQSREWNQEAGEFRGVYGGPNTEFEDLFFQSTIPTAAILARTELIRRYYNEVQPEKYKWVMGDYPMWLWFALNSKIAFLPGVTAVYRVLPESASHSRSLARRYAFRLNSNPVSEYFIEHYGHRMTPEFIHRARTHRHRLTLPMALQMRDWEQVAKIRQYFAAAAAQGHDTPADLARMLAHPHLWRHIINLRNLASKIKSSLPHR